jgi:hypothetical protein
MLRISVLVQSKVSNAVHLRDLSMQELVERTAHLICPAWRTVLCSCHHCCTEMLLSEVFRCSKRSHISTVHFWQHLTSCHVLEMLCNLSLWRSMLCTAAHDLTTISCNLYQLCYVRFRTFSSFTAWSCCSGRRTCKLFGLCAVDCQKYFYKIQFNIILLYTPVSPIVIFF